MTNQPQVNIKTFPINPSPETLYSYHFNRQAKRKHSLQDKERFKKELWISYQNWKKEQDKRKVELEKEFKKQIVELKLQKEVKDE